MVLREALANMVMHSDHFDSLRSCIRVYTDHIEFMNGGAFPLPVNEILGKVYSKLRNPTIARLFRYVGIAENAGYGIKKLVSWKKLTGASPTIESSRTVATVTFPLKSAIQRLSNPDDANSDISGAKSGAKTTPRQNAILALIRQDSGITLDAIAQKIGIGTSTLDREITKMAHLIRRVGSKNGGHWEIISD